MAGPAIRAWNIAKALSGVVKVPLVMFCGHEPMEALFELWTAKP